MKQEVVVIVGPTAVGKTSLSVAVAKEVGGEVVSADSRQVYRGLDIGTGKVTQEEMSGVPHHLIDVADPREVFSAADFVRLGQSALLDIEKRGAVPIIVGGTGFYIDALLGRVSLTEVPPNEALREKLGDLSLAGLQETLKSLDRERYETIDAQNPRRLIRAIEVAHASSGTRQATMINHSEYDVLWIGLSLPLPALKEKIKARLAERLQNGMLEEAKQLHKKGLSYERMEALGLEYRFMARHLEGKISYDEMVVQLETEIGQYARRQMTWFKRNKSIHWFSPAEGEKVLTIAKEFLM